MSRKRRLIEPGVIYHFIARFVGNEFFIKSEVERCGYLSLLGDGLARSDWKCLGFAVMSNHVHLVLLAGERTLVSWLRDVHARFAEWINRRRERIGAVFTRGPKMIAVRPEGVATLLAYLHNNPVRAGVVQQPGDSDWTSHAMYRGDEKPYPWVDVELGLQLAGFTDGAAFDRWVLATPIERAQLDAMRVVPLRGPGRPRKDSAAVVAAAVVAAASVPTVDIGAATMANVEASRSLLAVSDVVDGVVVADVDALRVTAMRGGIDGLAVGSEALSGATTSVRGHIDGFAADGEALRATSVRGHIDGFAADGEALRAMSVRGHIDGFAADGEALCATSVRGHIDGFAAGGEALCAMSVSEQIDHIVATAMRQLDELEEELEEERAVDRGEAGVVGEHARRDRELGARERIPDVAGRRGRWRSWVNEALASGTVLRGVPLRWGGAAATASRGRPASIRSRSRRPFALPSDRCARS